MKQPCLACTGVHVQRKYSGVVDYEYGTYHAVDFYRCSTCGLLMQDPLPDSERISSFYPPEYRSYRQSAKRGIYSVVKNFQLWSFARKIERILHCNKKATILEIGCGNGSLLLTLANIGYSRLSGTDISTAGAKPLSRKGIVFKSANIEKKFPFDKSFDVIILNQVFEHLLDPKFVLARCKEHISEKGKIIIATPNSDSVDIGIFNKYWDGINAPRHFFIFSVRAMESLAKKIGFKKLTIVALPDPGVWAISFQNVLQDIPFLRTRLKNGLAWYTVFLGVLFMPVSLLTACGKMSSSMLAILE